MKKTYNKVALNVQGIALEANIMGASGFVAHDAEHSVSGVTGGNGGDGLARGNNGGLGFINFD